MDRTPNDYFNRNSTAPVRQGTQTQQPSLQRGLTNGMTAMPQQPGVMTPTTVESTYYLAGLLTSYIGSRVRVQFLIGTTGPMIDITGTLIQVGANYIILQPIETDDLMICDLFSIKFTTVFR